MRTLDPFSTFGIEPRFDVDVPELERRHRELSRVLHPDRHSGKSAGERRHVLGRAIEVNDAFRVLRSPSRRAEALLERLGIHVTEGQEPKPDPSFLMDVLEQREELASARRAGRIDVVRRSSEWATAGREATLRRLSEAFAALEAGPSASTRQEQALRHLGELRYFDRFLEEVAAIEDEIG